MRSEHEDALPLIVTHGWPGSTVEQLKIIGPLTDPTAATITEVDSSHVMVSQPPAVTDVILEAVAAVGSVSELGAAPPSHPQELEQVIQICRRGQSSGRLASDRSPQPRT